MRVWVTRAEPGASATAERLRTRGHAPLVAPLLTVEPLPAEVNIDGAAALAFSSANGVAAFAERSPERALPVFAVGDATADAARAHGFESVRSADGDVAALAALILAEAKGPVLHAGGRELAGDLVGLLRAGGLEASAVALYRTAAATALPGEAARALRDGALDAVLVHSPKAARVLASLAQAPATGLAAVCISPAAAEPLVRCGFRRLGVARLPREDSMLDCLDELAAEGA